jgi:CheY-like chemotaxis protein
MFNFAKEPHLPTLLIIDDDMVSREVMATLLTMSGYSVHTADDGTASVELLESGCCVPDAILMDAQMPGLSGAPLIDALRARSRARVFAMSASTASQEVLAAADGFLLKPFGVDELRALLEQCSALSSETEAAAASIDERSSFDHKLAQASANPVVSPATLEQLRDLMSIGAIQEIYTAMVADLSRRIAALEVAMAAGDAAEVRRLGHSIKGGCVMAGAMQAARLGALIESGAAESGGNQPDNNRALLRDLRAAARNLERMLEAEFPA